MEKELSPEQLAAIKQDVINLCNKGVCDWAYAIDCGARFVRELAGMEGYDSEQRSKAIFSTAWGCV